MKALWELPLCLRETLLSQILTSIKVPRALQYKVGTVLKCLAASWVTRVAFEQVCCQVCEPCGAFGRALLQSTCEQVMEQNIMDFVLHFGWHPVTLMLCKYHQCFGKPPASFLTPAVPSLAHLRSVSSLFWAKLSPALFLYIPHLMRFIAFFFQSCFKAVHFPVATWHLCLSQQADMTAIDLLSLFLSRWPGADASNSAQQPRQWQWWVPEPSVPASLQPSPTCCSLFYCHLLLTSPHSTTRKEATGCHSDSRLLGAQRGLEAFWGL